VKKHGRKRNEKADLNKNNGRKEKREKKRDGEI